MVFLLFNYFDHTACALTHITNKVLVTNGSNVLHTLISFRNISSQVMCVEDIVSVYISVKITMWFQFQGMVL